MLDPVEEARAAEYRRKMTARSNWEVSQRFAAFRSSATAIAHLYADWAPWVNPIPDWDPPNEGAEGKGLQIP